jgi:hypothetical protein
MDLGLQGRWRCDGLQRLIDMRQPMPWRERRVRVVLCARREALLAGPQYNRERDRSGGAGGVVRCSTTA